MDTKRSMFRQTIVLTLWLASAGLATAATAQGQAPGVPGEMRRNVSVFEGVLREALDLDARRTIFSPRAGQVTGHYLAGQGVLMELTAALRTARRAPAMRRLEDAVGELGRQLAEPGQVTGALVRRPDINAMRESMALSLRRDEAGEYYRGLMERLSELDSAAAMDNALRLAGEAAEALRALGEANDSQYAGWHAELDALRDRLDEHLQQLSALRDRVREATAAGNDDAGSVEQQRQAWENALTELQARWPALRERAEDMAQALRQRGLQFRAQQQQHWRDDVMAFERRLYDVLCRYGASVGVPQGEYVTVLLSGLGEPAWQDGQSADRVHVVSGEALQACQRGDISATALRGQTRSYSF